jgi:hypothetical protein
MKHGVASKLCTFDLQNATAKQRRVAGVPASARLPSSLKLRRDKTARQERIDAGVFAGMTTSLRHPPSLSYGATRGYGLASESRIQRSEVRNQRSEEGKLKT